MEVAVWPLLGVAEGLGVLSFAYDLGFVREVGW